MSTKHLNVILLLVIVFSFSCTPYKSVPYFQDLKPDSVLKEKITNFSQLTVQPGDLLAMNVTSLNHEADAVFNYNLERTNSGSTNSASNANENLDKGEQNTVYGYLVDHEGNIHLPMVGAVKLAGLNTREIDSVLEGRLSEFLSKPIVNVRIQNFKISILGDVKEPGGYSIQNERITVIEALALAGDLNTTGIRKKVLLIREVDGNRLYINLNLASKGLFNSPYYYLKNNDVIYVQPNRDKVSSSDSAFQKVTLLISALSILAIFLTRK